MNRLSNWIEIPALDLARAKKFYGDILGASLQDISLGPVQYAIFATEDRFNSGALACGPAYKPSQEGITLYLDGGDDCGRILSKVAQAGGTVVMPKTFLAPEAGYIGMFLDTEGNRIGVQSMQQPPAAGSTP